MDIIRVIDAWYVRCDHGNFPERNACGVYSIYHNGNRNYDSRTCRGKTGIPFSDTGKSAKKCFCRSGVFLHADQNGGDHLYRTVFGPGICKDAGHQATAAQIELFCKLSVMVLSIPILLALLETIQEFLA